MSRNDWTNDKLFERLINNQSTRTYWENIKTLCSRPEKAVFKRCATLTRSKVPRERRIGIDVLSQLGGAARPYQAETLALYVRILPEETDLKVLESLLHAIGHNNTGMDNHSAEKLAALKTHRYAVIRFGVACALKGVDKPAAIDTLITLSADKDTDIRDWATFALGSQISRNNKAIREALWARTNEANEDTRMEAIVGLALRKDLRVMDLIRKELQRGDAGTLLFEAITELGTKEFLPDLKKLHKQSANDTSIHPTWRMKLEETIATLQLSA
ncbi:hypothetical protein Cpin_5173 [Chitinophaga pinensis DSM 2588]|uniref:HEAT repeat domain-containing protein n=2 Tax=Chitinophaga pinensis TaxID=79329 RepID=A0A979G7X0_CHIPD|nr:hypothetical protein Cpin_5173 [Chitinophaga pinensis DSM 2588]